MSGEGDGGNCRVCGRSALAHPSGACRSCRRGKSDSWVAQKKRAQPATTSLLTAEERESVRPRGWREVSRQLWDRKSDEKEPTAPDGH